MRLPFGIGVLLLSLLFGGNPASAQLPPRIMLAVDTSGSMAFDLNGTPTFGDGITTGCTVSGGVYCGANCTAGIDSDCDGLPNDSRIFVAKEAIRNLIYAYGGDIDLAMARFRQSQGTNTTCTAGLQTNINNYECNFGGPFVTSYGNPQCNTGAAVNPGVNCPIDWQSTFPAACRPSGSNNLFLFNAASSPQVCGNYRGSCGSTATGGGDVLVGFEGIAPFTTSQNTDALLKWIDNRESNPLLTATTAGNWCSHAGAGDCELRPEGPTPLAGTLNSVGTYMTTAQGSDPLFASCNRPYSIILITDGAQSTGCAPNDPVAAATALNTSGIRTYVVGLAITGGAATQLNAIAAAGGTDATPGLAGGEAFFANDPTTLSAGLSAIVADSFISETCDGTDEDCDGLTDEGFPLFCNVPAGQLTPTLCVDPGETNCDGVDDNCDGRIDEGVLNACGTCGPVPTEVCGNLLDDDCDGVIDEGCSGCPGTAETCNNVDDDCDGLTDEALTRACGTNIGECTAGTESCSAGAWVGCSAVGPNAEICDGLDNDCDGVIDGFTRQCGTSDVGKCQFGSQLCTGGTFGACVGNIEPSAEICDGIDNDCNGTVDNGNPGGGAMCGSNIGVCTPGTRACVGGMLACTGGVSPGMELCNGLDDDCNGVVDDGIPPLGACGASSTGECSLGTLVCVGGTPTCVGDRGPTAEVCDGLDNDCDGTNDNGNPGGGNPCGTATGVCELGTSQCVGGMLTCAGGVGPGAEVCDLLDNDCDGLVDEGNPGGGGACGMSDVGACEFGALACVMGMLQCIGETGPSPEICDGIDNNCNGMIDEGNPEGGAACGDDTGECRPGTTFCNAATGMLECMGAVGPTPEICDGLDNNCNGVADEGLPVGAPCGSDVGECSPGVNICRDGMLQCEGQIGPVAEVCDALDNDCDAMVDEGLPAGVACGSSEGLCMPGTQQCVDGREVCIGEVPPMREACDCQDNDCDGTTDETPMTGTLCPEGATCVDCQCALPCRRSEFGVSCPSGKTPFETNGECFCVAEQCSAESCGMETVERDGETLCGPDATDVTNCVCKNNECTFSCDGVVCTDGTVCNPLDPAGRCVEDSCRGLGCPAGLVCDGNTGECVEDACAAVTCMDSQACRDGACEESCAGVSCGPGQRCQSGSCVTDLCANTGCMVGEVCNPADGSCSSACADVTCPDRTVCDLMTGECESDPCNTLRCPEGEICRNGECTNETVAPGDAGMDGGDAGMEEAEGTRVLATGGGGCTCSTADGSPGNDEPQGPTWWLMAAMLFLYFVPRRRASALLKKALLFGGLVLLVGAAGCDVDPYCIDCIKSTADGGSDGGDGGISRPDATLDAEVDADAELPDGCMPGAPELCNMFDDDCDGVVDEGVDTMTDVDNCGGCGLRCAPIHAFGECVAGNCELGACDVSWYDLNNDISDGCEYRCSGTEADDTVCDLRDNDCDGLVDEDVAFDTDPTNCGACGRLCRFARATSSCSMMTCEIDSCDPNFFDIDGNSGNGCEYACTPASPAVEACNGLDDDCDGTVDEGNPEGGGNCGSNVGACVRGTELCMNGTLVCSGETAPVTESCDNVDNDCDGMTDEGNPDGGALCGSSVGTCEQGRQTCVNGALDCVGEVVAQPEVCDGLNNDCDGMIDEGDPGGGGSCGPAAVGACSPGTNRCRGGVLVCEGAVGATDETCDGADNDCDGMTDETDPAIGTSCGTDEGACTPGTRICSGGVLRCSGAFMGGAETCNGVDDDCDATVDEGNPGGGASCGSAVGACMAGTQTCTAGVLQCQGETTGSLESCDTIDNDCDGMTDEDFNLLTDLNNCGGCGTPCSIPNAAANCSGGSCNFVACLTGFWDINGDASMTPTDGCEYACSINGAEACNGIDDDCDMIVDEGLTPPTNFCNPNGVCMGTSPVCGGAAGWQCNYPATFEVSETRCDTLDNDCDGQTDEPFFPQLGSTCTNGLGLCQTVGLFICNPGDPLSIVCNAAPAGMPSGELCDNLDNDCDGVVDNGVGDIVTGDINAVRIPRPSGGFVRVMAYEASRPDATASEQGLANTLACSNANRLPWTDVTWNEANNACCALNSSGTCSGGSAEWRLCDSAEWTRACGNTADMCMWGYQNMCNTSQVTTCNGDEFDCSAASGDQDCLFPTGSPSFPMCRQVWTTGSIYDMSGNVREWTDTLAGAGRHEIRGGGFTNIEAGRTCAFDFTVADNSFSFPNVGFRCCYYE
ncbi:MAG: MopE-related protein [Myxococcota bacterium]